MDNNKFVKIFTLLLVVFLVGAIGIGVFFFANFDKISGNVSEFTEKNFGGTPEPTLSDKSSVEENVTKSVVDETTAKATETIDVSSVDLTQVETNLKTDAFTNGQELKEMANLTESEFASANEILKNCGINAYANVKYDGKTNDDKYSTYIIEVTDPDYGDILIYFDNNNVLQRVNVNRNDLYDEGQYLFTINDFLLSEGQLDYYTDVILETASEEVGAKANFNRATYEIRDPKTQDINIYGSIIYTDSNGNLKQKDFATYFLGNELKSIKISDFSG